MAGGAPYHRGARVLAALLLVFTVLLPLVRTKSVTILHTGDTLYSIVAVDKVGAPCAPNNDSTCTGGVARLATKLKAARMPGQILLVDSGSFLEGSLFSYKFNATVVADYYKQFAYDAVLITTREFFTSVQTLSDFLRLSGVPGVAANMDASNEPRLAPYIQQYVIVDVNGVNVGFTGEIDQNLKAKVKDSGNTSVIGSLAGLQKAVGAMLDQGVDVIVVALSSSIITPESVLDTVYGIDVILIRTKPANNTPIVHTTPWGARAIINGVGTMGKSYGSIMLNLTANGLINTQVSKISTLNNSTVSDPNVLANVTSQWALIQGDASKIVGETNTALNGSTVCELQGCEAASFDADVLREFAGTQVAITNGGSTRATIDVGPITQGELLTALPFSVSNTIAVFSLTGADLFASIENGFSLYPEADGRFPQVSGLKIYWNPSQPPGLRTVRVFVENSDGSYSPLSNSTTYSVATNSFMRGGGDGYVLFSTNAISPQDTGPFILNLELEYLAENSPITVDISQRIIPTNELRPDPNADVQDNYYVDWDSYPAIILIICSFFTACFFLIILIFILASVCTPVIKETSISFHVVQLVSMIISCFIIYIFIGTPSDGYCALRPWTSLFFTLVFGNLVAKQISITVQSIEQMVKKEDDSVLHVKYNPLHIFRNLSAFIVVNLIYLILWTAIDLPAAGSYDANGEYNSQMTCRSDEDVAWLVILFVGFAIMMLVGIGCSLWLHHVAVMFREADKIGVTIYLSSFMICLLIIIYNAIRDFPIPAFFVLGFGILIILLLIASIIYLPLIYMIIIRLIRGDKAKNKIDTSFRATDGDAEDKLDDL